MFRGDAHASLWLAETYYPPYIPYNLFDDDLKVRMFAVRVTTELFFGSGSPERPTWILPISTMRIDEVARLPPTHFDWSNKQEALDTLAACVHMATEGLYGVPHSAGASPLELPTVIVERLRELAWTILGGVCDPDGKGYRKLHLDDLQPLLDWLTDTFTNYLLTSARRVSTGTDGEAHQRDRAVNMGSSGLRFPGNSNGSIPLYEGVKTVTDGRFFYVTKTGTMGLGPASTRTGDSVHIFPGGSTHFMLRNSSYPKRSLIGIQARGLQKELHLFNDKPSSIYELVGDCYLNTRYSARTPGFGMRNLHLTQFEGEPVLEGSLPFELLGQHVVSTEGLGNVETVLLV